MPADSLLPKTNESVNVPFVTLTISKNKILPVGRMTFTMTSESVDVPEIVTVPPGLTEEIADKLTWDVVSLANADTGASVIQANVMERAIDALRISFSGFTLFISLTFLVAETARKRQFQRVFNRFHLHLLCCK